MANPISVTAQSNGAGAVAAYNNSVDMLQKRIPDLQKKIAEQEAVLAKAQSDLSDLLSNPVVLHDLAPKAE